MFVFVVAAGIARAPARVEVLLTALMVLLVYGGVAVGLVGFALDWREYDRLAAAGAPLGQRPWLSPGGRASDLGYRLLYAALPMLLVALLASGLNAGPHVIVGLLLFGLGLFVIGFAIGFVVGPAIDAWGRKVPRSQLAAAPAASAVPAQANQWAAAALGLVDLAFTAVIVVFFWPGLLLVLDAATNRRAAWWEWPAGLLCSAVFVAGIVLLVRWRIVRGRRDRREG